MDLAYNQNYKMFGKNCHGCNISLDLNQIYLNNEPYLSVINDENPGDYLIEIEPHTGIMTKTKIDSTMIFTFDCYK